MTHDTHYNHSAQASSTSSCPPLLSWCFDLPRPLLIIESEDFGVCPLLSALEPALVSFGATLAASRRRESRRKQPFSCQGHMPFTYRPRVAPCVRARSSSEDEVWRLLGAIDTPAISRRGRRSTLWTRCLAALPGGRCPQYPLPFGRPCLARLTWFAPRGAARRRSPNTGAGL